MHFLIATHSIFCHPLASLVNRTIDDEYGDSITGLKPIYFPQDQWAQGANCSNCTSKPLPDLAFDNTWHVSTYFVNRMEPPSIAFSFTGFAIYVYFITVPATTLYPATHLNVTVDGQSVGAFNYAPKPADSYRYNQLIYSNSDLASGLHTLLISTGGDTNASSLFDYAVYTTNDGTQPLSLLTRSSSYLSTGLPSPSSSSVGPLSPSSSSSTTSYAPNSINDGPQPSPSSTGPLSSSLTIIPHKSGSTGGPWLSSPLTGTPAQSASSTPIPPTPHKPGVGTLVGGVVGGFFGITILIVFVTFVHRGGGRNRTTSRTDQIGNSRSMSVGQSGNPEHPRQSPLSPGTNTVFGAPSHTEGEPRPSTENLRRPMQELQQPLADQEHKFSMRSVTVVNYPAHY